LYWLKSINLDKKQRFIHNRTKTIKDLEIRFRYVKSEDNPADIGSRGCAPNELKNKKKPEKTFGGQVQTENKKAKKAFDDIILSIDAETILIQQAQMKVGNNKIQKWNLHGDSNKLYRVHARLGNRIGLKRKDKLCPKF
uniref:Reverse transcriptase domain-containing protein n=1 Tax=Enterobius vermicularis TaxID=51028 RepID=A0A0N4VN80_ENTVE